MNTAPIVDIEGLGHAYTTRGKRRDVLHNLTLQVEPGEVVVITGPSGAGKTTLLTLCGALRTVQSGRLRVLGQELTHASPAQQRELRSTVGYIFQSHNLLDALTAGQNVVMSLLGRLPAEEAAHRAEVALARLGLAAHVDAFPDALSGGEKQRVAVARALVRHPQLILADEPTASLDDASAAAVKEAMHHHAKSAGCAVLLATHDARLFDAADRLLRLVDGAIVELRGRAGRAGASRFEAPLSVVG